LILTIYAVAVLIPLFPPMDTTNLRSLFKLLHSSITSPPIIRRW
jgi:hypothetical protein